MSISLLCVENFRNIASLELTPQLRGLNIIEGQNGSGKSSILESIYYLSHGKSFRTSNNACLIKQNTEKFSIFTQSQLQANQNLIPIGVERTKLGAVRLRLAGSEVPNFSELAALLPMRLINSQSHQLLESGPQFRRKFIDWGLFYDNVQFHTTWRSFERALKQRNSLLAQRRQHADLKTWTDILIDHALELHQHRESYLQRLHDYFLSIIKSLLPLENFSFTYHSGWDQTYSRSHSSPTWLQMFDTDPAVPHYLLHLVPRETL